MRRSSVFVLVAMALVLLAGGFRGSPPPVEPGGKIGTMTLVRGIEHQADDEPWRYSCNPSPKPGLHRVACRVVPLVHRLFIGYGDWERTRKALDSAWSQLKWELWFDGRRVDLPRFGTDERTLYFFPAAGGKTVILREWSVMLIGATPGKHTIRYRSTGRSLGTHDVTWTFTVV